MKKSTGKAKVSSIDWARLGNLKVVSKGTLLQTAGIETSKSFYVKKGLLRSYTIDDNGKIHIFMFAPEGWIITDVTTYSLGSPTELFVDTIEDSEIVELTNISLSDISFEKEKYYSEIQKLLKRLAVLQKRIIMLMSASAKQRYESFIEDYPQLINRIPLKMIASYLGITPEALSNIRRKIRDNEI